MNLNYVIPSNEIYEINSCKNKRALVGALYIWFYDWFIDWLIWLLHMTDSFCSDMHDIIL